MKEVKCIYGCTRSGGRPVNMKCVNVVEDAKSLSSKRYTKYFVCDWCKNKLTRKGVAL